MHARAHARVCVCVCVSVWCVVCGMCERARPSRYGGVIKRRPSLRASPRISRLPLAVMILFSSTNNLMRSQAHTSPRTNLTLETDLKHVHPTPGDETIGTKKTKQTADLKAIANEARNKSRYRKPPPQPFCPTNLWFSLTTIEPFNYLPRPDSSEARRYVTRSKQQQE